MMMGVAHGLPLQISVTASLQQLLARLSGVHFVYPKYGYPMYSAFVVPESVFALHLSQVIKSSKTGCLPAA